jgi:hypothetical protein
VASNRTYAACAHLWRAPGHAPRGGWSAVAPGGSEQLRAPERYMLDDKSSYDLGTSLSHANWISPPASADLPNWISAHPQPAVGWVESGEKPQGQWDRDLFFRVQQSAQAVDRVPQPPCGAAGGTQPPGGARETPRPTGGGNFLATRVAKTPIKSRIQLAAWIEPRAASAAGAAPGRRGPGHVALCHAPCSTHRARQQAWGMGDGGSTQSPGPWGARARRTPARSQLPSNVSKRAHTTRLGRPLGPSHPPGRPAAGRCGRACRASTSLAPFYSPRACLPFDLRLGIKAPLPLAPR